MSPSTRSLGRSPAVMCRSEASRSIISSSRVRRLTTDGAAAVPDITPSYEVRRSYAGLTDHLLERGNPLEHLEPPVHAQGEHPVGDRGVADLGRTDVHEDLLAQVGGHEHDLVDALTTLEPTGALIAAAATEERQLADPRVETEILEVRRRFLARTGLGAVE